MGLFSVVIWDIIHIVLLIMQLLYLNVPFDVQGIIATFIIVIIIHNINML